MDYRPNEFLNDPSVHYWIKDALRMAITKDPVDAVNDAALLLEILKARLNTMRGA